MKTNRPFSLVVASGGFSATWGFQLDAPTMEFLERSAPRLPLRPTQRGLLLILQSPDHSQPLVWRENLPFFQKQRVPLLRIFPVVFNVIQESNSLTHQIRWSLPPASSTEVIPLPHFKRFSLVWSVCHSGQMLVRNIFGMKTSSKLAEEVL